MELKKLCEGIGLMPEAAEAMLHYNLSAKELTFYKNMFWSDREKFYTQLENLSDAPVSALYIYLNLACDVHKAYDQHGISDEIYFATFRDLTVWCRHYYRKEGKYGFLQYRWLEHHLTLRLLGLGRLQFEIVHTESGKKALRVHIPEDGPLSESLCDEAFTKARAMFPDYKLFEIHSWLLYPGLKNVLPPESNILKFQQRFTLESVDYDSDEAEVRIFGKKEADPSVYPENTSLQRRAKAYVLQGERLGCGYGTIRI